MQTRTRRQRDVLDFIVRYIERHGHQPSYQLIARQLGLSSRAGIAKHVRALEDQGLIHRKRENGSFKIRVGQSSGVDLSKLGGIGWLEVAGDSERELDDWESNPFVVPSFMLHGNDAASIAAFRVPDDSMADRNICEGDVALIEKRKHARDGDCLAVTVANDQTLLRLFYRDGADVELRAANKDFETLRLPGDEVTIHGVLRGLLRSQM